MTKESKMRIRSRTVRQRGNKLVMKLPDSRVFRRNSEKRQEQKEARQVLQREAFAALRSLSHH